MAKTSKTKAERIEECRLHFVDWIRDREQATAKLKDRCRLMREIETELGSRSIDGKFEPGNEAIYRLVSDAYELLVIDVCPLLFSRM